MVEVRAVVTREMERSGARFGRCGGDVGSSRTVDSADLARCGHQLGAVVLARTGSSVRAVVSPDPGSGSTLPSWLDPVCLVDQALRLSDRSGSSPSRGRNVRVVPDIAGDPGRANASQCAGAVLAGAGSAIADSTARMFRVVPEHSVEGSVRTDLLRRRCAPSPSRRNE